MKTALLFGSSGLIGRHLLNILIQNNDYNKIKIFILLKNFYLLMKEKL